MKKQMSGSLGGFVNRFYSRHAETLRATSSASCRVVGRIWDRHPETLRAASSGSCRYQVCNNSCSMGFTLIELLVVVLIIGILAAVAVPQYQKVVEKSKATQAFAIIRSFAAAQEAYYMANGTYARKFDELAIDIAWTGRTVWSESSGQAYSNEDWSVQLFRETAGDGIAVARISGPYAGAGFVYFLNSSKYTMHQILCRERMDMTDGVVFLGEKGSYCQKIFKTQNIRYAPVP